jgi:hypothetical protein
MDQLTSESWPRQNKRYHINRLWYLCRIYINITSKLLETQPHSLIDHTQPARTGRIPALVVRSTPGGRPAPQPSSVLPSTVWALALTDFGDDSFREGLGILVASAEAEARLTERGRAAFEMQVVEHLRNRLQIESWYHRHPEIDEQEIVAPLIGLGLPRTASTGLACMLAADPAARTIRNWEAQQPCPPPETATQDSDPRVQKSQLMLESPDARFWMSHRDVANVLPSVADLYYEQTKAFSNEVDMQLLGNMTSDFCELGMRRMIAYRDAGNDHRFIDIYFAPFERDAFPDLTHRFEHHFRAQGVLTIDGRTRDFKGTRTRIHRQSIRRLEGFTGHCWLSALFPDGRAFGCLAYPPLAEKTEYSYNDAVIYQGGRMIPARIRKAPFLCRIVERGDDVSLELESELGVTRVQGVTALSTFRIGNPDIGGLNLQQGGALFTWEGQSAYGMVERSSHESLNTIG